MWKIKLIMYTVFCLLISISGGACDLEHLPEVYRQAVRCVKSIVNQYFDVDYPIVISGPCETCTAKIEHSFTNLSFGHGLSASDVIIKELTHDIFWPGIVWYKKDFTRDDVISVMQRDRPLQFVMVLSDYNGDIIRMLLELSNLLLLHLQERTFGGKAKLLIVLPQIPDEFLTYLGGMFSNLKIYDVVVILPYVHIHSEIELPHLANELYTWFPFEKNKQCGHFDGFTSLDFCIHDRSTSFLYQRNLFPLKLPMVSNGCPVYYLRPFNESSSTRLEWYILTNIFNSLNVTLSEDYHDKLYLDVFFFKTAGNAIINKAQMIFGRYVLQVIAAPPHLFTENYLFVPCPRRYIEHGKFYRVFKLSLWSLFFLTCIISVVVTVFINKLSRYESVNYNSISYVAYYIWSVTASVSVPDVPKTTKLRMFFLLWVCFCFVISTVFQSFFTSFLVEPRADKQISTMDDLLSKNLTLFMDKDVFFVLLLNITNSAENVNNEKSNSPVAISLNITKSPIKEFFNADKSVVLATDFDMKLHMQTLYNMRGIKPCSFVYYDHAMYIAYFKPLSLYREPFTRKVFQYFEAGLFIKLVNNYIFSKSHGIHNMTQIENKFATFKLENFYKFNIQHLGGVFFMYLCGNMISCIAFLVEIISLNRNLSA